MLVSSCCCKKKGPVPGPGQIQVPGKMRSVPDSAVLIRIVAHSLSLFAEATLMYTPDFDASHHLDQASLMSCIVACNAVHSVVYHAACNVT